MVNVGLFVRIDAEPDRVPEVNLDARCAAGAEMFCKLPHPSTSMSSPA